MTSVATHGRSAAYLTKANIVHPDKEAQPSSYVVRIAAHEAAARLSFSDRYGGVTVTGGVIQGDA